MYDKIRQKKKKNITESLSGNTDKPSYILLSAGYLDFSTWRYSVMFETAVLSGHPKCQNCCWGGGEVPHPCTLTLNGPLDSTCQMTNTTEGILTPSRCPGVVSHNKVSELGV